MKTRRAILVAIGIALAGSISLDAASAQTKWNLPAGYAPGNYHTGNLVWFADEVKKATGGA
ncbi:MAG: C4-dicarboxylate ABC transporter substrate-binding protein, partial [Fimbriimonadaceae bacterium]